jgi:two-component system NtrC family response regulator
VIPIEIPPLRSRREDIPLLVEHFLEHFCSKYRREIKRTSPAAMETLVTAAWPGNVRQLRNVIERLVITTSGKIIEADDIPTELKKPGKPSTKFPCTLAEAVEECEKLVIQQALEECSHHREKTAQALAISVRTLHYKMGRYGLH